MFRGDDASRVNPVTPEEQERIAKNWETIFKKRMIAVTFEHNHSTYSKLWEEYYGEFMDTKIIPTGDILKDDWNATTKILNEVQEGLFENYSLILFADVDEFIIPDPNEYKDLGDYLNQVEASVVRATGYNVMEMPEDKPLDFTKPIIGQRTLWSPDVLYNKYVIITKPQKYLNNHQIEFEKDPDPDLILFHLRDADLTSCRQRLAKLGRTLDEGDLANRRQIAQPIPERFMRMI